MWWSLDLHLNNPHLKCDGCSDPFMVEHACHCKRGGLLGLQNNILNKEWAEMFGEAYTHVR